MENAIQEAKRARFSDALNGISLYGRLFVKTAIRPIAVVEVVGYMGLVLTLFYLINPQDPLLMMLSFPWPWLVATALALRYGALLGVLAGLLIVGDWEWLYHGYEGTGPQVFPVMTMAGGLIQVILVGHVRDVWANTAVRANGVNGYLNDHLASLTTAHFLLRNSHDRLERDLFTRPTTLRGALEQMREVVPLEEEGKEMQGLLNAQTMLDMVAMICQLNAAAIYPVGRNGQIMEVPVAHLGSLLPLNRHDMVLHDCLDNQMLAHLKTVDADRLGTYYVAAPIAISSGELVGVLVVSDINFMSLNHDNMQLLLVLLDYYGDSLQQQQLVFPVHQSLPQCPFRFAAELERISHLKRLYDVDSSLVALRVPRTGSGDLQYQQLTRQLRALDLIWQIQGDQSHIAIFLMPLTTKDGIVGYLRRVETQLKQNFGTTLAEAEINSYSLPIRSEGGGMDLKSLYDQVRVW